jgi:hypothetical protein
VLFAALSRGAWMSKVAESVATSIGRQIETFRGIDPLEHAAPDLALFS